MTKRFDRGVGFFTSGWIEKNIAGVSNLAEIGGKIRWSISHILSEEDINFFMSIKRILEYKSFVQTKSTLRLLLKKVMETKGF